MIFAVLSNDTVTYYLEGKRTHRPDVAKGNRLLDLVGFEITGSLANIPVGEYKEVNTSMKHDVQVVLKDQIPRDRALSVFNAIKNVDRIETWNGGRGELHRELWRRAAGWV